MNKKVLPEELYIAYCLNLVEQKIAWHNSASWRHRDFVKLSELIFEKTNSRISITTLKRIWGKVNYEGNVGPTSLDALAILAGYKDWMDFKMKNSDEIENYKKSNPPINQAISNSKKKIISTKYLVFIIILSLTCIGVFFLIKFTPKKERKEFKYKFEVSNPKGLVPYSVKFNFDFSNFISDSIFIIAGDQGRKHLIKKTDTFLTRIYFNPGPRKAFLIIDKKYYDTIDLFAYTEGWLGIIQRTSKKDHPVYFTQDSMIKNKRLYISPKEIFNSQIDISEPYFVNYYHIKHFNIDGDNFSYKVRVKNKISEGGDVCQRTNIGIITSNKFITIPLINQGCLALAKLFVSDTYVNGWTNDLSCFAKNLNEWQDVFVKINRKKVKIYINNILSYETEYTKPLGEVLGFRFEFQGCGSVDYAAMFDENNQLIFEDDFGGKAD